MQGKGARQLIGAQTRTHLQSGDSRRAITLSLLAIPTLYGSALLFERLIAPRLANGVAAHLLSLLGLMVLPFLAFGIPCATVVWHVALTLSRRTAGHLSMALAASLVLAAILFVIGGQVRHVYGFDSPYWLFFLGASLEWIGPIAALAALLQAKPWRMVA